MEKIIHDLRQRIIHFQTEMIRRQAEKRQFEQEVADAERALYAGLFEIIDAFDLIYGQVQPKMDTFEKSAKKAIMSFRDIQKKLLRLLESNGVERMEFPDNKLVAGWCEIRSTIADPEKENDTIADILRAGFRRGDEVLRTAWVISVKNE